MRKRFNRNAVCSSQNYSASKKAHQELLQEKHGSFVGLAASDQHLEEIPLNRKLFAKSYMVTIWVFGKPMLVTKDEYDKHCQGFTKH